MTKKEAKKLFKKTYFYNDTFRMYYHFTEDIEKYGKIMDWIGVSMPKNIHGRCVQAQNNGTIRIFIGVFNKDISTLAHESVHAALFTLEAIGQDLSHTDELLPYLTEFIFRECESKMKSIKD